jgi:hypothetical protein
MKKSPKDFSLVRYRNSAQVRLTGHLKEFQGHRLYWRGSLSTHVLCVQKEAPNQKNSEEMHYNILQKM